MASALTRGPDENVGGAVEPSIGGQERQILAHRLRDQHSVEWIAVNLGEAPKSRRVHHVDREFEEADRLQLGADVVRPRKRHFAEHGLDRDFPG